MRVVRLAAVALALAGSLSVVATTGPARGDEVTISQNLLRDGWDQNEPNLTPAVVKSSSTFGQIFNDKVDGQVYAQPLVIDNHPATGESSVIVATENNTVYSIDGTTGKPYWHHTLGTPWNSSVNKCNDLTPQIGITSSPVYDSASNTVYVVAVTTGGNPNTTTPTVALYALDGTTGATKFVHPIGGGARNGGIPFVAAKERQRAGLLLLNGWVVIAFASYCDYANYAGFIATLSATGPKGGNLWTSESTGGSNPQAGIWGAGSGLMSDGTSIFFSTGNGVSPPVGPGSPAPRTLGDSVVRVTMASTGVLTAQDFFSPSNTDYLNTRDLDLASGGVTGLPFGTTAYPDLAVAAGKTDGLFLLDRDKLGGRSNTNAGILGDYTSGTLTAGNWGHQAAFAGSGGNDWVYSTQTGPDGQSHYGHLVALQFNGSGAKPALSPTAVSTSVFYYSSGSPVVTSNGTDPASAIVWEVYASGYTGANGALRAYLAVPAAGSKTLTQIGSWPLGTAAKFSQPAIDSGHIYVGTRDDYVHAFAVK